MKITIVTKPANKLLAALISYCLLMPASASYASETFTEDHKQWLMEQFSEQHQKLTTLVAVADMFYAYNIERKIDSNNHQIGVLVKEVDKTQLAQKLALCLGDDAIKSEIALNFGLLGCFHEQLADLPSAEKTQKMALVKKAISALSLVERQKSFTKCVSAQAMNYLN